MPSRARIDLGNAMRAIVSTGCIAGAILGSFGSAQAQDPLQARLSCIPRVGRGRVLCELVITASAGRLTWADAIIVEAPSFAPPLRDRVGVRAATERSTDRIRLPFALVAQQAGKGKVSVKARAVWCKAVTRATGSTGQELCVSKARSTSADVVVEP
jgi:hypothetical protein